MTPARLLSRAAPVVAMFVALLVREGGGRDAVACATAPPAGAEVRIAEEEAVIVWDPTTRTEHFIRRAAFRSSAAAFGFLVPTPTTPELGEVDDRVFAELAELIRPELQLDTSGRKFSLGSLLFSTCLGGMEKGAMSPPPAGVHVIQTVNVAGFDATTIEGDDVAAVAAWLDGHGFAQTPALTAWLSRYVTDHWKLTAFVVAAKDAGRDGSFDVATRAVRMSFTTDRPFYPYREPARPAAAAQDSELSSRTLRVFFLAPQRHDATMAGAAWGAQVPHADQVELVDAELTSRAGARPWVTVFVDDRSPRVATDELYFAPSSDQATVHPPPIVIAEPRETMIPIELIGLGLLGGVVGWRRNRARRRRGA